jgi:hypothetical protein
VEAHISNYHPYLFFQKNEDWAAEHEYRWLLRTPDPVPEFVPIKGSLAAIILGHDFPTSDTDLVDAVLASYDDVEAYRCRWDNGWPAIFALHKPAGTVAFSGRPAFRVAGAPKPPPPPSLAVEPNRSQRLLVLLPLWRPLAHCLRWFRQRINPRP